MPFAGPNAFLRVQAAVPAFRASLAGGQVQHRAIVQAIEAREGARAEALAREHARLAKHNLVVAMSDRSLKPQVPACASSAVDGEPPSKHVCVKVITITEMPGGERMNMILRTLAASVIVMASGVAASAQEVTLRLHQMLPAQATIPAKALTPWAEKGDDGIRRADQGGTLSGDAARRHAAAADRPG